MQNKRKENSVRSLSNLYTVVIGVALSLAVVGVIDTNSGLQSVTLSRSLLFFAFLVTLLPFYHGALRHLDDAYLENDSTVPVKDGALIVDFLLLFFHALAFVVLSLLLKNPGHFAWALTVVLTIDVLWGTFAHFTAKHSIGATGPPAESASAPGKWAIINFIFVGVSVITLVNQDIYLGEVAEPIKLTIPIAFVCTFRTLIDYVWCRVFYFPR